jgi:hypothetical protein
MALTSCPECSREVSTAAEACPSCGFPMSKVAQREKSDGPGCYACRRQATTRCVSCGAYSCAEHLQSIYVSRGRGGGAYELRCQSCYSMAQAWQTFGWVFAVIVLIIIIVLFSTMSSQGPRLFGPP